jgi:CRISPR type III-A-associated protein Csm2
MNMQRRPPNAGGPRDGRRGPSAQTIQDLWPDYLDGGYFDESGFLKPEYVSRTAGQGRNGFYGVDPLVMAMCKDGDRERRDALTTHQIRRYFGHCRAIETRLKSGRVPWATVVPDIKKLDIAAADGFAKQPPKIPDLFHDFIKRNVAKIKSEKDFIEGFLPHFEALVGFGAAYFKSKGN